jgi:hypothetical protein
MVALVEPQIANGYGVGVIATYIEASARSLISQSLDAGTILSGLDQHANLNERDRRSQIASSAGYSLSGSANMPTSPAAPWTESPQC